MQGRRVLRSAVIPRSGATRNPETQGVLRFAQDDTSATRPPGALHPSGAAESDGDLAALDDDRNPTAAGDLDHPCELPGVLLYVYVVEGDFPAREVLTGLCRVGSGVLPEDYDALGFHATNPNFGYYRKHA